MPPMGFEPTTPVFERAKTVHALDCAASVIGGVLYSAELLSLFTCISRGMFARRFSVSV
jgi:hypothetical protein